MDKYEQVYYDEIINTWVKEDESIEEINRRFEKLNKKSEILYKFVLGYTNYMMIRRDYGTTEKLSMLESHIVVDIVDNPGITVTDLAKKWIKTTSAISQNIKRLIQEGYIYREISKENAKFFNLYATDKGKKMAIEHKKYDNIDIIKTNKLLLKKFTAEQLAYFDKILEEYSRILLKLD